MPRSDLFPFHVERICHKPRIKGLIDLVMGPAVLFGGNEMSGHGRESGIQQMEEYLNVKAVWIKTA